jgi:hypothetical protein
MSESKDAPSRYSRTELQKIRDILGTPSANLACPKCEGPLTVSQPVDGPRGPRFLVGCRQCNTKAVVTDVPGMWQPAPRG